MSEPKTMAPTKKAKKNYKKFNPKAPLNVKVASLKKEVSAIKREIKQDVEVKNYDQNNATTLFGWDGLAVASLNNVIAQGGAQGQRAGDECTLTGLDFRYTIENTLTSILGQVRVIIFVDRENVLPVNQVLNLPAGIVNTDRAPMAFYNRLYRDKFTILYDKLHSLDATENSQYVERVKIPLNLTMQFSPGLTTVLKNMIKVCFIGNVSPAASPLQYKYLSRMYFRDP